MYDIAIIGGGPAGYVAAIKATQLGAKVILCEKDALGGTCLNKGCIPTKTMLCATDKVKEFKKLSKFGIKANLEEMDYAKLIKRKDINVMKLNKGVQNLLDNHDIEVIQGEAEVINNSSLKINDEVINFKNLIIATGSSPTDLPDLKADGEFILNSNDILKKDTLPESILIVGSGAIGIEWARIFSALNVKTTLIEIADQISPASDKDVAEFITNDLKKNKVKTYIGTRIKNIQNKRVILSNEEELEPEIVLLAAGRKPNTKGVERLGIELNKGFINVNNNFKTSIKNVYAIGDVNGHMQLAHVASHQGVAAVEHILKNKDSNINYNHIPFIIYGKPEIASVGEREGESFMFPMNILGKSITDDETDGFVKIIYKNDKITGAHIVAKEASSMIHTLALAIKEEISIQKLQEFVFAHPTYAEGIHETLLGIEGKSIHLPKEQK